MHDKSHDHVAEHEGDDENLDMNRIGATGGLNDDPENFIDDDEPYVTKRSDRRSSVISAKLRAESVIVCDSTPQHIDVNLFMGRLKCFSQRASTTESALKQLQSWEKSDRVQYAILHDGINDVRASMDRSIIISNLKNCLLLMHEKFPNACVAYSEMLYVWA